VTSERSVCVPIPHSTTNVWPLEVTWVLFEPGQSATAVALAEAEVDEDAEVTEDDPDVLTEPDTEDWLDVAVLDDADEDDEPEVISLAPQMLDEPRAAPRVDFR